MARQACHLICGGAARARATNGDFKSGGQTRKSLTQQKRYQTKAMPSKNHSSINADNWPVDGIYIAMTTYAAKPYETTRKTNVPSSSATACPAYTT